MKRTVCESDKVSLADLHREFRQYFSEVKEVIAVKAPGRVNLIGGHTDYNEGFVLPVAIDRFAFVLVSPRKDRKVHIYAADFGEPASFNLDAIAYDDTCTWSHYQRGIAFYLQQAGHHIAGVNMLIRSTVPVGAGLGSSAAVEMATMWAFRILNTISISKKAAAKLCQRVENEFVGVRCGIMDQFASALARKNKGLFIDCRSLECEYVPLETDSFRIVILNTNRPRLLALSKYNERRRECEEGLRQFQEILPNITALRDVSPDDFKKYKGCLNPELAQRCRHVIFENRRVTMGTELLKRGDMTGFGQLMEHSHISLRDNYEVSCRELDLLFEIAKGVKGVIGARMTGAGFGGCTVNVVEKDAISDLQEKVFSDYPEETGLLPEIYICRAVGGVRKL